jgi:DNA-binding NarL/FixJ family response regulator
VSATQIRVLLAEDHTIVRKGLRAILEDQPGIVVVGEAEDGRQAVLQTIQMKPDVVLMDFSMPGLNGLDATVQIVKLVPGVKVLVLTRHTAQEYIDRILKAGAAGYLFKKTVPEELVSAIQAVQRGEFYLDPAIEMRLPVSLPRKSASNAESRSHLITSRQREVLQLIAEGRANREIATLLHISVKTVENHRTRLMETLHLHSTAELTQYAIRLGLIALDE